MREFMVALLGLALQPQATEQVGDVYDIVLESVSKGQTSNGSTSSSRTQNTLVETVAAKRHDGVELIFSLPESASPEEKERTWQLPARVLKVSGQPFILLNAEDLKKRNITWRQAAGISDEYCERWFFTWTAVKIECNPGAVLDMLASFDVGRDDLGPSKLYKDPMASEAALLRSKTDDADNAAFGATMPIDPTVVREAREKADRVAAEITAPTLESLPVDLRREMQEIEKPEIVKIDGTVRVVFEKNAGEYSRERTVQTTIFNSDQSSESKTVSETVVKTQRLN